MTNLANNLTFYRKKEGLTQSQLGELLHVSAQAISKWENGQAEPGLDILLKLAEIYRVSTDTLLGAAPVEELPTPAAPTQKTPSGFGKAFRKFWYIPVIVLVLAAAAAVILVMLSSPARYGRMIENGKIFIGMTDDEARELLGVPTDSIFAEEYDNHAWILDDELNYEDCTYYVYYDEREAKNDNELWFGIKYEYLRLVFDKDGKLIEAFYNAVPTTEVWGYGETEHLVLEEYEQITYANGRVTDDGILRFTNGSVYLGEATRKRKGDPTTGILSEYEKIQTALGDFDIGKNNDQGTENGNAENGGTSSLTKTCYVCGEKKTNCKNDDRLTGEPEPVCRDCREEIDELLELD